MSGKMLPHADRSAKSVIGSALAIVAAFAVAVARAVVVRRDVVHLAELDDHLLRDIGLTRADVDAALQGPIHVDPSRRLMLRRLERRAHRPASGARALRAGPRDAGSRMAPLPQGILFPQAA